MLLIVYSITGGISIRMTLLQAKLSRESHTTGLAANAGFVEAQDFKANYEQWNLLSARPPLIETTVFSPPHDLLSGSILPSVGSFGIFHELSPKVVDLFYASADCLNPTNTPAGPDTRHGRLSTTHGIRARRQIGPWAEVTYCPNSLDFAKSLYDLAIGTPILFSQAGGMRTEYQPHFNWALGILASHIAASGDNLPVARTLLSDMGSPASLTEPEGLPSVVVIRSETPVDASRG